uniref:Uncharacterized protein n=1 Tax=Myotis myotis TaxID=51298 RepID=A0A7J7RRW0_MYOMY|nr:hypothetical protein mMyoMyo1_010219 [Myotis myotis]
MGLLIVCTIALDENSSLSQLSPFSDSSVARTEALACIEGTLAPAGKAVWGVEVGVGVGAGVTLGETTMGRTHAVWNAPCLLLPDFISFVDFPLPLFCPVCQRDGPAFSLPATVSSWAIHGSCAPSAL